MVRRIGNGIAVIVLLSAALVNATVQIALQLLDGNGSKVSTLAVGVPYLLDIIVTGEHTGAQIRVQGLDNNFTFERAGTSQVSQMINGVAQSKVYYKYSIIPQAVGSFTVGPAQIDTNQGVVQSNVLRVNVRNNVQQDPNQTDVLFTIEVEHDHVVVGQEIELTMRFLWRNKTKLLNIEIPDFKGFAKPVWQAQTTGTQDINGVTYEYAQWKGTIVPEVVGDILIIPARAIYQVPMKANRFGGHMFGAFLDDFSFGAQDKYVHSNSITLHVDSLPAHQTAVSAVGAFTNITASLDSSVARAGEGIVLKLMLEGKGNLETMEPPALTLPDSFKYYASKNYRADSSKGPAKVFEYIIQGFEAGQWEIEPQPFTFYDPQERQYKTLHTQPLSLLINPAKRTTHNVQSTDNDLVVDEDEQCPETDICPLITSGNWYYNSPRIISWSVFLVLLFCALGVFLIYFVYNLCVQYRKKHVVHLNKKNAFSVAYKTLKNCYNTHDPKMIYDMFVTLFADRCCVNKEDVSAEYIERVLHVQGFDRSVIAQWNNFFDQLREYLFFKRATVPQEFIDRAKIWIKQLEEKL